ncbi:MAG: biosynthetic peptidoglycan transglycosylase [Bdellovibrionales bacterium]
MKKKFGVLSSLLIFAASGTALFAVVAVAVLLTLPDVRVLERCFTTSMYEVNLCPGSENYVNLRSISPYMIHAVIVAEDGAFYSHEGFDWHEMQESFEQNLRSGHIQRGGSTLTQQLAKNVFLGKEKSVWRKIKEAYLAHAIEKHYKKDFILEKYLNVVEFGDGIYGVRPASLHYFHKSPSELNPLEAAYLAFLLPNPKGYSKNFRTGTLTPFTRKTVSTILKRMAAYGKLSPQGYSLAMAQLPNFPWSGLSADSFQGAPSYSLDAPAPAPGFSDPIGEENALDEVVREEQSAEATASGAAAAHGSAKSGSPRTAPAFGTNGSSDPSSGAATPVPEPEGPGSPEPIDDEQ